MNTDIIIMCQKVDILKNEYKKSKINNSIDEMKLKESLCDVLSWFEICIKKISGLDKTETKKISAITYANNMKKHSTSIFKYTLNTEALILSENLVLSDDLILNEFSICWNTLPLDNVNFKNQYNNYNQYLKDKDLYSSIVEISNIIQNHYIS